MHLRLGALVAALTLLGLVPAGASASSGLSGPHNVHRRATDQSPKGYAPSAVDCPADRPKIRPGSDLSPQEKAWLRLRQKNTIGPIRDLFERIAIPGFNSSSYLARVEDGDAAQPIIGISLSGGGYRAMLNGGGALEAWDDRSPGSTDLGNLGGLLQSATYLCGLSGSAWLVGSLFGNNFTTVTDSINSGTIWKFQHSILEGPGGLPDLLKYYTNVIGTVEDKAKAGYPVSITDYWGRMLSFQLFNAPDGAPGFTFSSIAEDSDFAEGKAPLPIIVADARAPGEDVPNNPLNSTDLEYTPWEFGSRDPQLNGFVPLKYAGSKFFNGSLPDNESCIVGFDNLGFLAGSSSSLFNAIPLFLTEPNGTALIPGVPDFAIKAITDVLKLLGEKNKDVAQWAPNPFRGWNPQDPNVNSDTLPVVDGGEDLQEIPLNPLVTQQRKVDVIFAVDSDADTKSSWPDGTSMVETYNRAIQNVDNGTTGFPFVPDQKTFLNLGLNTKPVFFGCNATNTTGVSSPLVVYLPNYPYFTLSNISTFALSVDEADRDAIITNGWAVVTQANSTRDKQWPVCVGCAILARSFDRTKTPVPDACNKCFQQYCWNGTRDESTPADYEPALFGAPINTTQGADSSSGAVSSLTSSAVSAAISALLGALLAS